MSHPDLMHELNRYDEYIKELYEAAVEVDHLLQPEPEARKRFIQAVNEMFSRHYNLALHAQYLIEAPDRRREEISILESANTRLAAANRQLQDQIKSLQRTDVPTLDIKNPKSRKL